MNIEQYRAMKERETNPVEEIEQVKPVEEVKVDEPKVDEVKDDFVEINGEQIKIDELKNGYLRQSDYTKKTQKLASEKKEAEEALSFYQQLKQNPQAVESINSTMQTPRGLDPTQQQISDLEDKLYDMIIEKEVVELQAKYEDFEVMDVMKVASERNLTNLEDAYHIYKATNKPSGGDVGGNMDIDKIREDLKKEILAEINGDNTDSIISTKGGVVATGKKEVVISKGEARVASAMGMGLDEYAKWRDANK